MSFKHNIYIYNKIIEAKIVPFVYYFLYTRVHNIMGDEIQSIYKSSSIYLHIDFETKRNSLWRFAYKIPTTTNTTSSNENMTLIRNNNNNPYIRFNDFIFSRLSNQAIFPPHPPRHARPPDHTTHFIFQLLSRFKIIVAWILRDENYFTVIKLLMMHSTVALNLNLEYELIAW